MSETIQLSHGDGGEQTMRLIRDIFIEQYGNEESSVAHDSFVFPRPQAARLAFTTDSFTVNPIFFRGGDIGKLAVCGTINDLAAAGASPLYMSAGFIIEEGFQTDDLRRIAKSMGEICKSTGVKIVTGDTKVVEKGYADGVFINTSGIGVVSEHYAPENVGPDDEIIITGTIARHGTAILIDRYYLHIDAQISSDCEPLNYLIPLIGSDLVDIKLMKDPTRGGLATVLNEIASETGVSIVLEEQSIPISDNVRGVNNMLGIDPLYLACEGRMIIVANKGCGQKILTHLKNHDSCREATLIGKFESDKSGLVYMKTEIGGKRLISSLQRQNIPRIC